MRQILKDNSYLFCLLGFLGAIALGLVKLYGMLQALQG